MLNFALTAFSEVRFESNSRTLVYRRAKRFEKHTHGLKIHCAFIARW